MNKSSLKLSIICPVFNEEKYIERCINSILLQDYAHENIELLFIDGCSSDKTVEIIQKYADNYKFIKIINNPHKYVPQALNIGIKHSEGDVIIRIDGHCIYPVNYFTTLVHYLYKLNADNVGVLWNTVPAKDTTICKAIAITSSHIFGVGGSKHKIGSNKIIETDTVPFGCYKREVFDRIGLFDEDLIRNQDDEFNARLIKNGGKIFLIPELVIDYFARDTLNKTSRMYYQYGLFKPLVNKKLKGAATIRQFMPAIFTTGLIFGPFISLFSVFFLYIYIFFVALYLSIGLAIGIKMSIVNKDIHLTYSIPFIFLIIHLSYGMGYLQGIFKVIFNRKFTVSISR